MTIAEAASVAATTSISTASISTASVESTSSAVVVVLGLGLSSGIVGRGFFTGGESDQIGECNGDCKKEVFICSRCLVEP